MTVYARLCACYMLNVITPRDIPFFATHTYTIDSAYMSHTCTSVALAGPLGVAALRLAGKGLAHLASPHCLLLSQLTTCTNFPQAPLMCSSSLGRAWLASLSTVLSSPPALTFLKCLQYAPVSFALLR